MQVLNQISATKKISYSLITLVIILCVLFIAIAYVVLYQETRRHQKMIKTQQLPQEEVEQFLKESKALKTTVYVVGAVMLCLLPTASLLFFILLDAHGTFQISSILDENLCYVELASKSTDLLLAAKRNEKVCI